MQLGEGRCTFFQQKRLSQVRLAQEILPPGPSEGRIPPEKKGDRNRAGRLSTTQFPPLDREEQALSWYSGGAGGAALVIRPERLRLSERRIDRAAIR